MGLVTITPMTRTVSRSPVTLPLSLTPEQAAAIAVALAAQPDGPYAAEGRGALEKVIAALEPDPRRREALVASTLLVRVEAGRAAAVRSVVEQGLLGHRVLVLHYRDGRGLLRGERDRGKRRGGAGLGTSHAGMVTGASDNFAGAPARRLGDGGVRVSGDPRGL